MFKYELDKERLNWLSSKTNRSKQQTQELFNLCKGDYQKLLLYEYNTKNCFLHYCAGNKIECLKVLEMKPQKEHWNFVDGWDVL